MISHFNVDGTEILATRGTATDYAVDFGKCSTKLHLTKK